MSLNEYGTRFGRFQHEAEVRAKINRTEKETSLVSERRILMETVPFRKIREEVNLGGPGVPRKNTMDLSIVIY
jgi:hypothetical protein